MDVISETAGIMAATSFESVPDLAERRYSKSVLIEILARILVEADDVYNVTHRIFLKSFRALSGPIQ